VIPTVDLDLLMAAKLRGLADDVQRDIERLVLMQRTMLRLAEYHASHGAGTDELAARFTVLASRQAFERLPEAVLRQLGGPR
jgi:hypothetical protein